MDSIEQKVRGIIVALSGNKISDDFDREAHVFRDLGIESTKALELLFEIEDQFEVAMPDMEDNACEHLGDLVTLIAKLKQ